jgi:hypothetical protein
MGKYVTSNGAVHEVTVGIDHLHAARQDGLTLAQHLNRTFADADPKIGTAFQQIAASEGLAPSHKNPFGVKAAKLADILDGTATTAAINTKQHGSPFGSASRLMFPNAVIEMVEDVFVQDLITDASIWDRLCKPLSIDGPNFEQLVVSVATPQGAGTVRAQRIAQNAEPTILMQIKTADRIRRIGSRSFGIEMSDQALKAGTIDQVALMVARQLAEIRNQEVYDQLSAVFVGDNDMVTGAVPTVTTTSLDAAATAGVVTHKSWVKALASQRKKRRVTHVFGDINAYLAVEGRTGRPGTNNYDPSLARVDPQANLMNNTFGGDVQWMVTDELANGGPVPAGELWMLDATRSPVTRVQDISAAYSAQEEFAMRRSTAWRLDYSSEAYRTFGDTELTPFYRLVIS